MEKNDVTKWFFKKFLLQWAALYSEKSLGGSFIYFVIFLIILLEFVLFMFAVLHMYLLLYFIVLKNSNKYYK